ncbi:unnamed protein product [Lymnaea stagnalis]|uniref:Uncharacterized protein n=1 Tax=Lymnaea stagnalis TaxID=6523 RepID=A0AAV2HY19_LYMST
MDRTLSRSVPHLPRYQSASPARSPRLDTRRFLSLHGISQPSTHISYIDGAPTRGINSYHVHHSPSPKRSYNVHVISSKVNHHLVRTTTSLSAADLNSSHLYSSLDDLIVRSKQENEQRCKAVSCEDIFHKKPFFPDITPSESGISVGEWEEGSMYGGEEDSMSQRSFGSSSAFFDGTVDSELEKLDSDNCSGHEYFRDGEQDDSRGNRRSRSRRSSNEVPIPDGVWNSPFSSYGESRRKELMSRDFERDPQRFGALKVHIPTSDPPTRAGKDNHQSPYSKVISSTPLAQSTPHVSPRGPGEHKLSVKASWMADYPLKESNSELDPGRGLVDMDLSDNDLQSLCHLHDSSFSDDNFSDISNVTITSPELRKPKLVKKTSSKPKTSDVNVSSMPLFDEYMDKVDNCHSVYQTCSDGMGSDTNLSTVRNDVNQLCPPDGRSISGDEWWALYNIGSAKERKALEKSRERAGLEDGAPVVREETDRVRLPLITPGKHGQEKLRRASQTSPKSDRSSPVHSSTVALPTVGSGGVGAEHIGQSDREVRTEWESIHVIAEGELAQGEKMSCYDENGEKMSCYDESSDTVGMKKAVALQDRERDNDRLTKATMAETDLGLNIDFSDGDKVRSESVVKELTQRTNKQGTRYLLESETGEFGVAYDGEESDIREFGVAYDGEESDIREFGVAYDGEESDIREFGVACDGGESVGHLRKQWPAVGTEIEEEKSSDSLDGLIGPPPDFGNTHTAIITLSVIPLASPLHHVNSWTNGGACSESRAVHDGIDHVGVSHGGDKEPQLQQRGLTVGLTVSAENTNTDGFIDSRLAVWEGGEIPLLNSRDIAAVVNFQCADETKNIHKGGSALSVPDDTIAQCFSSETLSRTESSLDASDIRDSGRSVPRVCEDPTPVLSTESGVVAAARASVAFCVDSSDSCVDVKDTCHGRIGQQGSHGHPVLRPVGDESIKELGGASIGDAVICQAEDSSLEAGVVSEDIVYDSSVLNHQVETNQWDSGEGNGAVSDSICLDSKDVTSTTVSDGFVVIPASTRDPTHRAVNASDPPFLSVTTLTQETGSVVATASSGDATPCQAARRFIASSGVSLDGVKTAASDGTAHCTDPDYTRSVPALPTTRAGSVTTSQPVMQHNNPLDNLHAQLSLISAVDITTNEAAESYQDHAEATHVAGDVYEDSGDYCYLSEPTEHSGTYYSYSIQVHSGTKEDSVEVSPREQYDNEDVPTTTVPTYTPRRHHQYSLLKPKSSSLWTLEEETESMLDAQSPKPSPKRSLPTVPSEEENSGDECSPLEDEISPLGDECSPLDDESSPLGDECSPLGQSPDSPESLSIDNGCNSNIVIQDKLLELHSATFYTDPRQAHQGDKFVHTRDEIQHEHLSLPMDIPSVPLHAADATWSIGQRIGYDQTTPSLCGPIPVDNFSNGGTSPLDVLSSSLQQFWNHESVGEEDDLFIVEDERDHSSSSLTTSRHTRHDGPLSWNDDEVSEASSRLHDFDQELSVVSSSVSPSPSDASEGLLYTCVGTAQVKHVLSSFDYDNPVSRVCTGQINSEEVRGSSFTQDVDTNKINEEDEFDKDNQFDKENQIDKEDEFEKLLEEFNQCTSTLADMGEVVFCELRKDGTALKPTQQLENLYKAFTNEDSEKKQNHVCIVIEDDNMSTYRLKRYLKKSHTKRTAGKKVLRFLTRLGCVSETTCSPELSPNRSQRSEHGELVFSADNMPSHHTRLPRPTVLNSTSFQSLHLLARSAHGHSSTTSSNQSLDSLKSRADSAYSSFSESMLGEMSPRNPSNALLSPACPLSSTGSVFQDSPFSPNPRSPDSVYSSTSSDKTHYPSGPSRSGETSALNNEMMTALSDVFEQLDVCNDEIDTALLNRLRHGHTRADI